tara:strand:+ start:18 stop:623 length:606 start_codon:yes stop_codon:yes gene_type:complete
MKKQELKTTKLLGLNRVKDDATKVANIVKSKNLITDISYNLENLKNSPNNIRTQKELIHSVKINLHYHYLNKVPLDDVESIVQDTCNETIMKVLAGEKISAEIIRNFAHNRYVDTVRKKYSKKRTNNDQFEFKSLEVNDKPIEHNEIKEKMRLLPKEDERILEKIYFRGKNLSEISKSEMKSPSTIHRHHKKALKRLKKFL